VIRVRGPRARGLNKPAILLALAGGLAIVLGMASGAFTGNRARAPADAKPMMSDPARPEMARGATRALPSDYTQVPALPRAEISPAPPPLGPPLPGDVAAFAEPHPDLRAYTGADEPGWGAPQTSARLAADPAAAEAKEAARSGLFFSLRDPPRAQASFPLQQTMAAAAPDMPASPLAPSLAPSLAPPIAPVSRLLFPGTVIPAGLVTEVNSESPGPVIAQVTQAIYDSATGNTLLIPQGARLIGAYRSSARHGESRVAIVWSHLIMPDGTEVALEEAAADPAGAAGLGGQVDNHWGEVFGAAALGTLLNVGVATSEDPRLAYGGIGLITRDPVDAAVADGVQRSASAIASRVVDRGLAISPTIRVPAGARLTVIVTRATVIWRH
jgi:type IV secretion system protein VirB10